MTEEPIPDYKLTEEDIEEILSVIRVYNRFPEVAESLLQHHRETIAIKLREQTYFDQSQVQQIKADLERDFMNSLVNPGEPVGPLAAISIGEPATQMILKSHQVIGKGQTTVQEGVPRLKEILNGKINNNTPSTVMHFTSSLTVEDIKYLYAEIPYIILDDILYSQKTEILGDEPTEWWEKIFDEEGPFPTLPFDEDKRWQLRLYCNVEKCIKHRITIDRVRTLIEKKLSKDVFTEGDEQNTFQITSSPMELGIINIHINIDNINVVSAKEDLENIVNTDKPKRILYQLVLKNITSLHISGIKGITEIHPIEQRYSDLIKTWEGKTINLKPQVGLQIDRLVEVLETLGYQVADVKRYADGGTSVFDQIITTKPGSISSLQRRILYSSQLNKLDIVEGKDNREIIVTLKDAKNGKDSKHTDFKFFTSLLGELKYTINSRSESVFVLDKDVKPLIAMLEKMSNIDTINVKWAIQTVGNNLTEILMLKGIDPALTSSNSLHEIYKVFGVTAARDYIIEEITRIFGEFATDPANIRMLANGMTHRGALLKVNKAGINSQGGGGLVGISFEGAMDIIVKQSVFGEVEDVTKTIASALISGNRPMVGSSVVDVIFDPDYTEGKVYEPVPKPTFKLVRNIRPSYHVLPQKLLDEENEEKRIAAAVIAEETELNLGIENDNKRISDRKERREKVKKIVKKKLAKVEEEEEEENKEELDLEKEDEDLVNEEQEKDDLEILAEIEADMTKFLGIKSPRE